MSIDLPGFTKPTVGRIVHFYDTNREPHDNNGVGAGPYAATVAQAYSPSSYISLAVTYPFQEPVVQMQGSVPEGTPGESTGRFWCWPPRSV